VSETMSSSNSRRSDSRSSAAAALEKLCDQHRQRIFQIFMRGASKTPPQPESLHYSPTNILCAFELTPMQPCDLYEAAVELSWCRMGDEL
jgi:hypothetical protein